MLSHSSSAHDPASHRAHEMFTNWSRRRANSGSWKIRAYAIAAEASLYGWISPTISGEASPAVLIARTTTRRLW